MDRDKEFSTSYKVYYEADILTRRNNYKNNFLDETLLGNYMYIHI